MAAAAEETVALVESPKPASGDAVVEVTLNLNLKGLGIEVAGGTDDGNHGVFVLGVDPSGAAAACGLKPHDQLVTVNGVAMAGRTHAEAVALLQGLRGLVPVVASRSPDRVLFVVDHNSSNTAAADADAADADADATVVEVAGGGAAAAGGNGAKAGLRPRPAARGAYLRNDAELSRQAHANPAPRSSENHNTGASDYLKAMAFGGMDGIITTFSVVSSIAGANLSTHIVLIMGFANLIGDGVSMGFGEFISMKQELQFAEQERRRELWELDNYEAGEIEEMVEIYEGHGFTREEAQTVLGIMSRHRDFFVDHMMVQELGIMPPGDESPFKQGLAMFLAFIGFGIVPLLSYLAFSTIKWSHFNALFLLACIFTGIGLFGLGVLGSRFTHLTWWQGGLQVFASGAMAAIISYLTGLIVSKIVGDSSAC